jgi:hypothetical protein
MKLKLLFMVLVGFFIAEVSAQSFRNEWIDYSKTYYKFKVFFGTEPPENHPIRKKLVRITQPTLQSNGLGSVLAEDFQLFRNGVEVPIFTSVASGVLGANDYIEFWGEINDGKADNALYRQPDFQLSDIWSLSEDAATYFLTTNPTTNNKRLQSTINNVANNTLPATEYFMRTIGFTHRQRRYEGFAAQAALPLYSSSYDRGEGYATRPIRPIGSACGQVSFTINMTNLRPYLAGPSMTLKVNAVGSANNARTVLVRLNGNNVMNFQMDYFFDAQMEEFGLPVSLISSGNAAIQHINQSGVSCDEFRLVKNELTYPRSLDGNNLTSLELSLPASNDGHYLKFYNFNYAGGTPVLYDLTNGKKYEGNLVIADTIRFLTEPSTVKANLVLVNSSASNALNISTLQTRNFVDYNTVSNQGDYIIISNPLIYGSGSNNYVQQYKDYRSSAAGGNYQSILVDINEITDQFGYGIKLHPIAVRNFLNYARTNFAITPKFTFLIGKGLNYIDYRANGGDPNIDFQNLVPTWGHPASDNLLSAIANDNPIPQIPIGRLSAVSPAEVGVYLAKVKQYDSLQNSPTQTVSDKAWMKNVLQVAGANDYNIGTQLDAYMKKYKAIIEDSLYGAKATNFDKLADPSAYTQSLKNFKNIFESGASLITYFGHSSSTNLDFNLDNPSAYNNQYRYPIFIVNGCDAGNLYLYESQRLSLKTTLSEKFVLEPQKGAIGYLATTSFGVVNYLDSFTTKFYRSLSSTEYNKPFGEVIKSGIANVLNTTGGNDFFARFHAEQFNFHGDPALKLNTFAKPDYIVEANQISVTPQFISTANDSFYVKVKLFNVGQMTGDSVNIKLERQYPDGNTLTAFSKRIAAIAAQDSLTIALPIVANRDKGNNILTAVIDYTNSIDELSENNNVATLTVTINEAAILPVYPYKYAIVNNASFKLAASTANPLTTTKSYIMEIDTTALFNSSLKFTQTKASVGGVVEFDYGLTLTNNTTYYWRVAVDEPSQYWNTASFTYKTTPEVGFTQQHYYQHTESSFERMELDSTRKFNFNSKPNNLFVLHSIYPFGGTEDQQFSIKVNGAGIIASACLGSSVIINVIDTLTFKPRENLTNPFGAEPTCDENRKYNFEYAYTNATARNNAKQFLESIPNGMLVAVRLVYDGVQTWANEWAADTLTYGSGNSLYHFLKRQGLPIDSFNAPRTFGIIFKKNDSARFSPRYQFTNGLYDRVVMNVDYDAKDTLGFVTSPKFGPAKAWKNVLWSGAGNANSRATMDVIGIDSIGAKTVLHTLDTLQNTFNISAVSASQYPYIQLKFKTQDSILATPYQLRNWSVEYDAVPEGAIAPNLYFNIPDSVGVTTTAATDTLKGGFAFKNVGKVNFDSLTFKATLYNLRLGTIYTFDLPKTKALLVGDTLHANFVIPVGTLPQDDYNLYLVLNENGVQKEQYLFNNSLYKYVYLKTSLIVPVRLLNFVAKPINTSNVELTWEVTEETNMSNYVLEHSTNANSFKALTTITANNSVGNKQYNYRHINAVIGKNFYRLKMVNKDGSFSYSPVRLIQFSKGVSVNIYPNPVVNFVQLVVTKEDNKANTAMLYNNFGQLLTTVQFNTNTQINFSKYAAGTYLLKVNDGSSIQTFTIQKM